MLLFLQDFRRTIITCNQDCYNLLYRLDSLSQRNQNKVLISFVVYVEGVFVSKAVTLNRYGPPDVLQVEDVKACTPKNGEVLVKHSAIGVNRIDLQMRSGQKTFGELKQPLVLGYEASGVIQELGDNVDGFKVGDKVAYATAQVGAYVDFRCIHHKYLITVPDSITEDIAAASIFKGLTAHYLAARAFIIKEGTAVLIHGAAGGVGRLLSQIANSKGAVVIGTVISEQEKQIALEFGCHKVFNTQSEDWVASVLDLTKGIGVTAVYDGLGAEVFDKSLECLMRMGVLISYGDITGQVSNIDMDKVRNKSIFVTAPSIFHYKSNRMELLLSAHDIFSMIESSKLKVEIEQAFSLSDVAKAHQLLESGNTRGSIILKP